MKESRENDQQTRRPPPLRLAKNTTSVHLRSRRLWTAQQTGAADSAEGGVFMGGGIRGVKMNEFCRLQARRLLRHEDGVVGDGAERKKGE